MNEFCNQLDKRWSCIAKTKTPCIVAGDTNIDFRKFTENRETADYLNNLLINNFTPTVLMPTRITSKSANLNRSHLLF